MMCGAAADGNDESCVITANRNLYAHTSEYTVEYCCDYLTIGSTQYRGSDNGPFNVFMSAGTTALWSSDYSVVSGGFTLCGTAAGLPLPPPVAPPAPPPPHPPLMEHGMFTQVRR